MSFRVVVAVLVALCAGIYVLFAIATRPPEAPAHHVFINGHVLTMDQRNTVAQAVSVRGDRIEAIGSSEAILALVSDRTDVTDLRGRTLMPGFIDAHGHFPGSGQVVFSADLRSPPIGGVDSMAVLLQTLKAQAERRPEGWVTGFGYDDTLLAEGRHPSRYDLDKVSTTRPVLATHVSGHLVALNSAALAALGITAQTPDPAGGHIVRDPTSASGLEPLGVLEETAARLAMEKQFDIGLLDAVKMTTTAAREYLAQGVTTASAGGMPLAAITGMPLLSRFNVFPQRLVAFPLLEDVQDDLFSGEVQLAQWEDGRVTIPRVKILADGSIQGYTGYLSQPYHTPYKGDADYRGYPSVALQDLVGQVAELYRLRIPLAIHANGDASIDDALDAIELALAQHPWPEARPLLIHAQMARKDQIERMAALGVSPSFFSAHTYYWGDRHRDIFMGPERAATMSPAAWALEEGVRFTSHMDTPVTPMLPLQAVWSQVTRQSTSGAVIGPEQRIDRLSALRAVTIDAAWQAFLENDIGSIEAGKLADLVILSGDPLVVEDVRDIVVERVFIGGATVYSRR